MNLHLTRPLHKVADTTPREMPDQAQQQRTTRPRRRRKASNDNLPVRSESQENCASDLCLLHQTRPCERSKVNHFATLRQTVPSSTMSQSSEITDDLPFRTTLERDKSRCTHNANCGQITRRTRTTTTTTTTLNAKSTTRLFPLLNYNRTNHHQHNQHPTLMAIFIVILHLTAASLAQQQQSLAASNSPSVLALSQEMPSNDNKSIATTMTSSASTATISTTAIPATANRQELNNQGDINRQQQAVAAEQQQQQQPAIEQVAKAEALTASSSNQQHHHHHHQHHQQPQSIAAALHQTQQSNVKLFEVCKSQTVINQHITNLSQIVFQPSDICSNWHKMSRSDPPPAQSVATNSEINPWYYIEQLNLSENNLTVLHDSSGMSRLIHLLELKITYNQLSRCEEASLFGLQRLQNLDLSHNKLVALPSKFFQPVKHTIKKLNLSFNSISVLVPTLFDSLNQLEYLDLSHNDITSHWINDKLFKNLTQLHYLDLSFNKLTVFSSPMTFSSLQQLETVSLQHNELRQVPETIQHLRSLSSLDLSQNLIHDITNASYLSNCRLLFNLNLESNLLENITRDAFSDLPALKVLNLANNRIYYLDQQAFDFVPDLHALRLDSNRLVDFGQAFVNLRFLLMLNISSNRIGSFDYAQIPLGLQWLDLHSNKIDKLNNFYYSPSAQQQFSASNDILSNQQASIGQQWQSMLRLTTLDASHNLIRELDNTSLPESLETVQLNNNHIKTIASQTFSTKSNLTRINLSHNQLTTLPFDALKLNSNRDGSPQLQQQKFVDVYLSNNPFVCNCNMGWFSQLLLASSNPFQSGVIPSGTMSRDHTFMNIHSQMTSRQLPRVADAALVNCHLPFGRQTTYTADPHQWSPVQAANQLALQQNHHSLTVYEQPLILRQSELLQSVHLCPYKSHCFALCYCCDFDACDCEMSCPENCSCYYDQTWSTNIVDCSANNQINGNSQARFTQMMMGASGQSSNHHYSHHHHHRQPSSGMIAGQQGPQIVKFMTIPEKIPMDVTDLFLDGLELLHLRGNALIGRRNLKSLYLNNSQLYSIEPKALATQKALRVLQLNSNFLTELHGYEFEHQSDLRELYLANNRLTSIANMTFSPLKSLQILHLQNNQLYHFNFWSNIPSGHKLISLNLGSNPWSCQCDHIEPMLQWLQVNMKSIYDRKSVTCQYDRGTALHLISPLATEDSLGIAIYGTSNENYPMFDKKMCLNYTVVPVTSNGGGPQSAAPTRDPNNNMMPSGPDQTNVPSFRPSETMQPSIYDDPQPMNSSFNPSFHQPPNDEPPRLPNNFIESGNGAYWQNPSLGHGSDQPSISSQPHGIQYPPNPQSRVSVLTPSLLIGATLLVIILIIVVLSLIHYRRPMGTWFYQNYGLNMFSAGKSHKNSVNSLGKHHHHHHPHLNHQYGVGSSAGSTSSSSAASSNLSQALCQQQQHQAVSSSAGLVTTPLIVTSSNQTIAMNSASATPYQDDDRLFDAYLTYSKFDEQFVNDFIAPELECNPPSYRVALHYRDLPVTTSEFLTDCIIEAANASRRVIMVVSEQFLRTEWMQFEFRSAHLEALKNNYRQRLIIILLGQPSLLAADLDPDLVQWLKSCTCLHWGEKMFWQRLRFSLPSVQYARTLTGGQGVLAGSAASAQPNQYLRHQGLAPYQQHQLQMLQQQQQKTKRNNLGANLLRSATGLLGGGGGGHNNGGGGPALPPSSHQQLITSNMSHQSLARPLPQPGGHFNTAKAGQQAFQQHLQEEHHYAHLTPATMIQQQQQQGEALGYHQPIYGDPSQQVQQQQQRDNPVHI